jgi:hypothetical protein
MVIPREVGLEFEILKVDFLEFIELDVFEILIL